VHEMDPSAEPNEGTPASADVPLLDTDPLAEFTPNTPEGKNNA